MTRFVYALLAAALSLSMYPASTACAEDGYELWLRYRPLGTGMRDAVRAHATTIVVPDSPALPVQAATRELQRGLSGMLEREVPVSREIPNGAILIGTPQNDPAIAQLDLPLEPLGQEGFLIRSVEISGNKVTVIAANGDTGLVYGAFELLRLVQTGAPIDALDIVVL